MLKIRLQRVGKKNSPNYRVVLAEHTAPPQGKFQEILGHYNPRKKEKGFKKDRIEHWLKQGAQLSPTVHNLLIDEGILRGIKLQAWKPKKKKPAASQPAADKQAGPPSSEGAGGEEKPKEAPKAEKPENKPKEKSKQEVKKEEKPEEPEKKEEVEEKKEK